jgi:hypothetical protein
MAISIQAIKNEIAKSGTNKGKFIFFKEGTKIRLRFLNDMEDGVEIPFHDSFKLGVNVPCQEMFGRECSYCEEQEICMYGAYMIMKAKKLSYLCLLLIIVLLFLH